MSISKTNTQIVINAADDGDAIRATVRAWIAENVPAPWLAAAATGDMAKLRAARPMDAYTEWYPTLAASGMVVPTWPKDAGGLGLDRAAARSVDEELGASGLVRLNVLGIGLAGPTILQWGTPAQKDRYLPGIIDGSEPWCQLFSEPGAGSDLASLSTRAVRDGDDWIVNGQKVWTSFAKGARFGMLLARTDPTQPKHSGISYFALDLTLPGVTIRPLVQMTGDTEFNEIFLEDVRVSNDAMLGPAGDGWKVAGTTLMNERVAISGSGGGFRERIGGRSVERLITTAAKRSSDGASTDDSPWRQRLSRLWIESHVIRWTNQRSKDLRQAGQTGPDGSIGKLLQAEHNRRLQEAWVDLLGASGTARDVNDLDTNSAWYGFLRARANTIEGGTSEIQRNIIGERMLGLPREPSADAGRPWKDVARN